MDKHARKVVLPCYTHVGYHHLNRDDKVFLHGRGVAYNRPAAPFARGMPRRERRGPAAGGPGWTRAHSSVQRDLTSGVNKNPGDEE